MKTIDFWLGIILSLLFLIYFSFADPFYFGYFISNAVSLAILFIFAFILRKWRSQFSKGLFWGALITEIVLIILFSLWGYTLGVALKRGF